MTKVRFYKSGKTIIGFSVIGHSTINCEDQEGKLICSAISSAAYMAANTITEIVGDKADIEVEDGKMILKVSNPSDKTVAVLEGFKLHIEQLSLDYSDSIKINSEV